MKVIFIMISNEWFHIDLGNQIDNKWTKDSALAVRKKKIHFSIKIKAEDKKKLKKKFILDKNSKSDIRHNRRIISIIYCFMLFKLLKISDHIVGKVKLCKDAGPEWAINKYLSKICKYYGEEPITNKMRIRFRKSKSKKSEAHRIARDIARGRKKETYCLNKKDIEELTDILRKIQ